MTNHSQKNYESIRADVSKLLNGEGYTEIMNNSLSALKYQELLPENEKGAGVRMLNPLSQDLGVMRQRMLWGAMENVAYNVNRQAADLRFFEFGKTYSKSEKGYLEKSCLALTLTGARYAENWDRLRDKTSLYDLRAVVQELIIRAGLQGEMKEGVLDSTLLDDGIVFEVRGKELARIGKVNSKTMKAFDVKQEVFHVEIDWHLLCTFSDSKSFKLQEIPKFPAVRRDLSLLLDTNVRFAEIKDVAQRSGGKLLKEVLLFDVYEGKNLPAGKVSYAIGFIIQDETSTLTDKVVEKIMHKVQANLEKEFKAELRQ
jgi:phenylalanyl-tRNA synthetase beta chain